MIALLAALLLQAPNEPGPFLAALDKDRASGTPAAELLQRVETWLKKKRPAQTVARLEWNRELLKASIWIDGLRVAWLTKKLNQSVSLGSVNGLVKDVKADRVTLDGKEIPFFTLRPDEGLAEIRAEKLLEEPGVPEAVLLFAAGKTDAAFAMARAFPGILQRAPCLRAFTGWALQRADKLIAEGKLVAAAEFLAADWTPHEDLMDTVDGALQEFVRTDLVPPLLEHAKKIVDKDRKAGGRVLDLFPRLTQAKDILGRAHGLRFATLDASQWHAVPLDSLDFFGSTQSENGKVVWEDSSSGPTTTRLDLRDFPYPWDKISGIRARLRPEAPYFEMHVKFGVPSCLLAVYTKEKRAVAGLLDKDGGTWDGERIPKVADKPEYLIRFEGGKEFWKIFIDNNEVKLFRAPGEPSAFLFTVGDGKCELLSLEIRRK